MLNFNGMVIFVVLLDVGKDFVVDIYVIFFVYG